MQPTHDDRPDTHDVQLDRNLQAIGRALPPPATPSAAQRAGWKRDAAPPGSTPALRIAPAPDATPVTARRRAWRFAGAGMALAASLAFGVLALWPTGHAPVEAKQIFASFSEQLANSFKLTIQDIQAEGFHVSGEVMAVFPDDASKVDESDCGVTARFNVRGDKNAEDFANGDLEFRFALAPEHEWAYLRINKLPREIIREGGPAAAILYGITRDGVLLKLDGLMDGKLAQLGGQFDVRKVFKEMHGELRSAVEEAQSEIKAELSKLDDAEASDPEEAAQIEMMRTLEQLMPKLFTGGATADDLRQLGALLEQAAGHVTVEPTGNGGYVLEASQFEVDENDSDAEMLARIVLRIHYRPQVGVERAEILNVGEGDGRITIELGTAELDDRMFDESTVVEEGKTKVFDLGELLKTFGPMLEAQLEEFDIDVDEAPAAEEAQKVGQRVKPRTEVKIKTKSTR